MDWDHYEKEVVEAYHLIAKAVVAYDESDDCGDCVVEEAEEHDEGDDERKLVMEQVACLVVGLPMNEMIQHLVLLHIQSMLS